MTTFAEELYERLAPIATEDAANGYALQKYCNALAKMTDQVENLVRDNDDGTPGWTPLVDPTRVPDLDTAYWLAQMAGVRLEQGLDLATAKARIIQAEGRRRGTLDYMIEVAQRTLTGAKTVFVSERDPDAYHIVFTTRTSETPTPAATLAALMAVKPAGIILTHSAVAGVTWNEPTHTWDAATLTWDESAGAIP